MDHDEDFSAFMAARWGSLYRYALLLCGDSLTAEDLTQAALTKAYVAWPRIHVVAARDSYLRTTITRLFLNERRRHRWTTVPLPDDPSSLASSSTTDDHSALWDLIRQLPNRQRAVLVLRYYEGLSETEIAEVMGCSRGTVKSQAFKALASLRRSFPSESVNEAGQENS